MRTVQFIRHGLDVSASNALSLIQDMSDAPLTFPTPAGGNHPLWVLGHIVVAESKLIHDIALGRGHALAHWMDIFGPGTTPVADPSVYPPLDEVLRAFQRTRAATLEALSKLDDADLDRPSAACPPDLAPILGTLGKCFFIAIYHMAVHTGQVADARRAAGREPLFRQGARAMQQPSLAAVA
jgi:uncharacterized damage-inducible protein DinB